MKVKILVILMAALFILTGCKKEIENPVETPEIEPVEIVSQEIEKLDLNADNFMKKAGEVGVETSKEELMPEEKVYLVESYSGKIGNLYTQYSVYTNKEDAKGQFDFLVSEYIELWEGTDSEIVSEDTLFTIKEKGKAFVGIKVDGEKLLIVSAGDNLEAAETLFSSL